MYAQSCIFLVVFLVKGSFSLDGSKIYNGEDAKPHVYPWMVSIVFTGIRGDIRGPVKFCGGALVSRRYVLTAAHCMGIVPTEEVVIYLGDHNFTETERTEQVIPVLNYTAHPLFSRATINYDVALVELSKPARLNTDYVKTVDSLSSKRQHNKIVKSGKLVTLTGWGYRKTDSGWQSSDILQTLSVKLLDDSVCEERGNYRAQKTAFCYEAAREVCSGSCSGDSGSPLVAKLRGKHVLVGVHSYRMNSRDGCVLGAKGATKAFKIASWVDSIIS